MAKEMSYTGGQGSGGRLKEEPAPELVNSSFRLEIGDAPMLWDGLSMADLAHVVMLFEAGIIPERPGRRLLQLLLELHEVSVEKFVLDPVLEDVYSNRERWLQNRDSLAAGWVGAGRPRREPATIAYRIATRERLLSLGDELVQLCHTMTDLAEANAETVMPDYTYLQHAHPTTLGHYLLSFAYPFLRDLERLKGCFSRINESPAGIGNINGSRLPLRRERLAELLGFDASITNTRDAMWQVDTPVEIMAMQTAMILHMDRLSEDLQLWNTSEFDLVELADRHTRISLIMPQKKNPYALAYIRGVAGTMLGRMVSMAAVGKTPSAQMDNRIFVLGEVPRSLDCSIESVKLMRSVLTGLAFDNARMAQRAAEGYPYATDLAEVIMQTAGIDFRRAHRVVGLAIRKALEHPQSSRVLSSQLLDQAAHEVLGCTLNVPEDVLSSLANPTAIVATRNGLGGAAREPVQAMIRECRDRAATGGLWCRQTTAHLEHSTTRLLQRASRFASN